ncbi:MAG: glycosyltransferase [bacterium]|nr:glycosyltransferase [bacterium]
MKSKRTYRSCKVLFFDHSTQFGGAEHSLKDIICRIKFKPVFVSPSNKTILVTQLEAVGIKCITFPMPLRIIMRKRESPLSLSDIYNLPTLIFRFFKLLRKENPCVVYTNTQKAHIIGVIAARLARIPSICHFRDILPRNIITKIWLWILYLLSTRIIADSRAVAEKFPMRSKVKVVYPGIRVEPYTETRCESAVPIVGYVGQIAKWKGIEYFIKAADIISKKIEEANFIIVGGPIFGDYKYLEELKELSHKLGMSDKIQFIGEKIPALPYIAKLNVLVHTPILPEPFGRVLIEAGALGKPVVASNNGAIPEIVENGVTGILVPPGETEPIAEAVISLLMDKEKAKSMGEKGRERVDKCFNVDNMKKRIEEVIAETVRKAECSE